MRTSMLFFDAHINLALQFEQLEFDFDHEPLLGNQRKEFRATTYPGVVAIRSPALYPVYQVSRCSATQRQLRSEVKSASFARPHFLFPCLFYDLERFEEVWVFWARRIAFASNSSIPCEEGCGFGTSDALLCSRDREFIFFCMIAM